MKKSKKLLQFTIDDGTGVYRTICSGIAQLTDTGEIIRTPRERKLSEADYLNEEIKQCIGKSKHVARWFIGAGTTENVYACLGVRP